MYALVHFDASELESVRSHEQPADTYRGPGYHHLSIEFRGDAPSVSTVTVFGTKDELRAFARAISEHVESLPPLLVQERTTAAPRFHDIHEVGCALDVTHGGGCAAQSVTA